MSNPELDTTEILAEVNKIFGFPEKTDQEATDPRPLTKPLPVSYQWMAKFYEFSLNCSDFMDNIKSFVISPFTYPEALRDSGHVFASRVVQTAVITIPTVMMTDLFVHRYSPSVVALVGTVAWLAESVACSIFHTILQIDQDLAQIKQRLK